MEPLEGSFRPGLLEKLNGLRQQLTISQVVVFFQRNGYPITKTMIQNYMRSGVLPPLKNSRYYTKLHIVIIWVVEICKPVFSLSQIAAIFKTFYNHLPPDEETDRYAENLYLFFIQIMEKGENIWQKEVDDEDGPMEMMEQEAPLLESMVLTSMLYRCTESLLEKISD